MMMVVVTFVSLMVHVYTMGYMAEDPGYNRFFSYISLFTFAMLMLVSANNFLQLFFGWEAVGLVSYLLIGFWYTRPTAIYANLKAFMVNRVGDLGFLLGIGLVLAFFGSLDYAEVFAAAPDVLPHEQALLPPGWDAAALVCKATPDGDGWRLDGPKLWITSGNEADLITVFARAPEGVTAFLVETARDGFGVGKVEEKLGVRSSSTVEIILDGYKVEGLAGHGDEKTGISIATDDEVYDGTGQCTLHVDLTARRWRELCRREGLSEESVLQEVC